MPRRTCNTTGGQNETAATRYWQLSSYITEASRAENPWGHGSRGDVFPLFRISESYWKDQEISGALSLTSVLPAGLFRNRHMLRRHLMAADFFLLFFLYPRLVFPCRPLASPLMVGSYKDTRLRRKCHIWNVMTIERLTNSSIATVNQKASIIDGPFRGHYRGIFLLCLCSRQEAKKRSSRETLLVFHDTSRQKHSRYLEVRDGDTIGHVILNIPAPHHMC